MVLEMFVARVENSSGKHLLAVMRDITARVRAEQALQEREARLKLVQENSVDGINLLDLKTGKYVILNSAQAKMTGFSLEELNGISAEEALERVHPDDREISLQQQRRIASGENDTYQSEYRWKVKSGEYRWFSDRRKLLRDEQGQPVALVGTSRDITADKENEVALRASEAKYRSLFESIDEGFCIIEMMFDHQNKPIDFRFLETNPTFERQTGLVNVVGKTIREVAPANEEYWFETYGRIALTGEPERVENKSMGRWYEVYAWRHGRAEDRHVAILFNDINARKQAEEASVAREAAEQANQAKTRFLAAVSHDLRQPLQAITLFSEALSFSSLNEKQRNIAEKISQASRDLGDMLSRLLDIAKLDRGVVKAEPSPIESTSLLGSIHGDFVKFASEKNLRFDLFVSKRCSLLYTDNNLLVDILRNLVSNAVKYTEHGGLLVGIRRRGNRGLIQVWDTGIGIPPKDLGRVFEEYYQVNNLARDRSKGYGLGLSIAKRLAAVLEAEIHCRSRLGRGSVFEISVPLHTEEEVAGSLDQLSGAVAISEQADLQARQIVVVEDDHEVAMSMKLAFEARGMEAMVYGCAEDALRCPEVRKAECFVSDYRLPGMDGLQFLNTIRKTVPRAIKAVLLTGEVLPERIALAKQAGWAVVTKPVRFAEVLAALDGKER
ncbi:MAG TPA: PAS domain S-box protein [Aquabacterium sp.]|nr:PAS domain S-box protein [Aquabacterium sp.]